MNSKEYVTHFKLSEKFSKSKGERLLVALGQEFKERCIKANLDGTEYKDFQNVVNEMRLKFNGISNKVPFGLSEDLWRFFYSTQICVVRDELYPNLNKKSKCRKR